MTNDMGKIAIVTGGSRGIGAAICQRLARDGVAVAINYAKSAAPAVALRDQIVADGGRAVAIAGDVAVASDMTRLFDEVDSELGRPDILVNNAGAMALSPISEVTDDTIETLLAVNIKGVINGLRLGMTRLGDGGRIINLSSTVVALNMPGYGVYTATKAAVESLSAIASKELRGRGITVNCVAPGPTATELFFNGKSEALIDTLAKSNPLERLGTPEDIAGAVAFLAGPDGGWVNGQVLRANGGMA